MSIKSILMSNLNMFQFLGEWWLIYVIPEFSKEKYPVSTPMDPGCVGVTKGFDLVELLRCAHQNLYTKIAARLSDDFSRTI